MHGTNQIQSAQLQTQAIATTSKDVTHAVMGAGGASTLRSSRRLFRAIQSTPSEATTTNIAAVSNDA